MTQTPLFRRSRDLDKSNKFRQMQELTNDYYSEIKLHNIVHIEGGREGGRERGGREGGRTVIHILIGMFNSNPMTPQYLNNNLT